MISRFDLSMLISRYGLRDFVETGYGSGAGVRAALAAGFESVASIEIVSEVAEQAGHEWSEDDERVTILENNSYDGLSLICQKTGGPILFWLDAYFPGRYGYEKQADEFNCPLEIELEVISVARDASKDVILIGGLSIYERGCERPIPGWQGYGTENSKFIERLFGDTHDIARDHSGHGFAALTPKKSTPVEKIVDKKRSPKVKEDEPVTAGHE